MRSLLAAGLALLALPAPGADHARLARAALEHAIRPAAEEFARIAAALPGLPCPPLGTESLAYHGLWDAWMRLSPYRFGPLEEDARALQIQYWPDAKGLTARAVRRVIAARDPGLEDSAAFAGRPIAERGLMALERVLTPEAPADAAEVAFRCRYARAIATDLARLGAEVAAGWAGRAGRALTTAGASGNAEYLTPDEATRRILTGLTAALEETATLRLARPLGILDQPAGRRAEAWRSGRSLANAMAVVSAAGLLYHAALKPDLPQAAAGAFEAALAYAERSLQTALAGPPLEQAVAGPGRVRIEVALAAVEALRDAVADVVGPALGVLPGFNATDGD